jgi:hypothetical protein
MKIQLELEDFRFVTTRDSFTGENRWLLVKISQREFFVKRNTSLGQSKQEEEWVDRFLVEKMEFMLRKVFVDACAATPLGTQLLDEEAR